MARKQAHVVNDLSTQHLAAAARAAEVKRFVFTSTGLVYGASGGRLAREDDHCAPQPGFPRASSPPSAPCDPHIAEVMPMMRDFPPAQRMSSGHHADVAQAVERVLDAPSPSYRVYNVVDDEAPDLATLFASAGGPPPDGSNASAAASVAYSSSASMRRFALRPSSVPFDATGR